MGGSVENVTDENYEELTESSAAVVAYGIASCEPCAAYDPVLNGVAEKLPHVRIGKAKMHVPGTCRDIKKRHAFETYPTTHLYSRGKLRLAREGKIEEDELIALIQRHLSQVSQGCPPDPPRLFPLFYDVSRPLLVARG